MLGGVFLEVLPICYNTTGAFLVAGIYLIEYDRGFVILLVNLLVRLTVFRRFSVFHPLWLVLFHTVDVSIFSWVLTLFATVWVWFYSLFNLGFGWEGGQRNPPTA